MLTILEYAQIAKDVYQEPPPKPFPVQTKSVQKNNGQCLGIDKKPLIGFYRMMDVDKGQIKHHDFFAQLYFKFIDGKPTDAVVAYRGTDNIKNWLVDIHSWDKEALAENRGLEQLPKYIAQAQQFYCNVREYIRHYFPELTSKMTNITGHSLGGALAALAATSFSFPALAVTFNAPGVAKMPSVHNDMLGRVYNIQARYDVISKIGKQCTPPIYVDVPNEEKPAEAAFAYYTRALELEHAIEGGEDRATANQQATEMMKDEEAAADSMIFSVSAQHNMLNMLNALQLQENTGVAYRAVT